MTRTAFGRVAGPDPTPAPLADRMMTISELADALRCTRVKIEADVDRGLPCIDIGHHDPRRRVKRCLRFDWNAVISWYERQR